jgi:hypothetical protein
MSSKPMKVTDLGPGDLPHSNDPQTMEDLPEIDEELWIEYRLQDLSGFVDELMQNESSMRRLDDVFVEIAHDIKNGKEPTLPDMSVYGARVMAIAMAAVLLGGDKDEYYQWLEERNNEF